MDGEKILGVIPNASIKKSIFKTENYNLIISDKRLIAAKFTSQLMKEEAKKRVDEAKEEKKNKLTQFFVNIGTGLTFYKRYLDMNPEEIIKESEGNYTLEPDIVKSVTIKKGTVQSSTAGLSIGFNTSSVDSNQSIPHRIIIETIKEKMIFFFNTDIGEAKSLLTQLFKNVKY